LKGSYFSHPEWTPFLYKGLTHQLDHLHEYQFAVVDTDGVTRNIGVTFSDHCFTRDPEAGDDSALAYPGSSRPIGHFCFVRYNLSLRIRDHISQVAATTVWTVAGDNFAALPLLNDAGKKVLYGIIFSLDRVTGLPVQLHMRVKTAYPIETEIITFGSVRFRHLVALRIKKKRPGRIAGACRKAPKAP
jgi:hypothetical protein